MSLVYMLIVGALDFVVAATVAWMAIFLVAVIYALLVDAANKVIASGYALTFGAMLAHAYCGVVAELDSAVFSNRVAIGAGAFVLAVQLFLAWLHSPPSSVLDS